MWNLSSWLKGIGGGGGAGSGMSGAGWASLLGRAGAAISPEGSWQQRLGATAAQMGAQEQSRKYLAELLGTTAESEAAAEGKSEGEGKEEKSDLSTGQLDALRNPGLGGILADYFSKTLPGTGR